MIYKPSTADYDEQLRRLSASSPAFSPALLRAGKPSGLSGGAGQMMMAGQIPESTPQYKQEPALVEGPRVPSFTFSDSISGHVCKVICLDEMGSDKHHPQQRKEVGNEQAFGQYVASQVASRMAGGVQVRCLTRCPVGSPGKKSNADGATTFMVSGEGALVEEALRILVSEYPVNPTSCLFGLPEGTTEEIIDLIDPERLGDLSLSYGELEAKLSFRQPGTEALRLACRREVLKAQGLTVQEVELSDGLFAGLVGPKMNRGLLEACLSNGVILDLPSPIIVSSDLKLLVAGPQCSVDEAVKGLQDYAGRAHEYSMTLDRDILECLQLNAKHYRQLSSLCQRQGCLLRFGESDLTLISAMEAGLRTAVKKLHVLLYEFQKVIIEIDSEHCLEEELGAIARAQRVTASVVNGSTVMIVGERHGVERAVETLTHIFMSNTWIRRVQWTMAVSQQVREFVSGKKDGKLVKIMRESDVSIQLAQMCDSSTAPADHLLVRLEGNCILAVLTALGLLRGELPAEITFNVPESEHKRLIGHGGKVIQQVMKKYAVYVKFLNAAEAYENAFGGCHQEHCPITLDNVIIRTPAKNGAVLEAVKEEILVMAEQLECIGHVLPPTQEEERVSIRISKMGVALVKTEARKGLLKLMERVSCGLSLKGSWFHNDFATLKVSGPRLKVQNALNVLMSTLPSEDKKHLFPCQEAPASPTLTVSSSGKSLRSTNSSVTSSPELFRHFNSALFPQTASASPFLSGLMPRRDESHALPNHPGAPGSGRAKAIHSPNPSDWSTSNTSWSSQIASPRTRTLPERKFATTEDELMAASRILDSMDDFLNLAGKIGADDDFGPMELNSKKDPVMAKNPFSFSIW